MDPINTPIASKILFALTHFFSFFVVEAGAGEIWRKVEKILAEDQGLVVLDGIEKVPATYEGYERPVYGDWLVLHAFSEPATLNPYKGGL